MKCIQDARVELTDNNEPSMKLDIRCYIMCQVYNTERNAWLVDSHDRRAIIVG